MEISDRTLHFVFTDDVKKPLLVECYWVKGDSREPLQLLDEHVGRAKPRRDALCILFLLAKYRWVKMKKSDETFAFKVDSKEQTWIGTLGDAYKTKDGKTPIRKWVETHFLIDGTAHFFSGHSGSDRSGGKSPRKVEYDTKQFPPQNLQFFLQASNSDSRILAPLSLDGLFHFALTLEKLHWTKKSAIWELVRTGVLFPPEQFKTAYPQGKVAANQPILTSPSNDRRTADRAYELMLEEFVQLDDDPECCGASMDRLVRNQIKVEFDEYRNLCQPFFTYMKGWSSPLRTYHESSMNRFQAELFRNNCLNYAGIVCDGTSNFFKALRREFGEEVDNFCHRPECESQLLPAIEGIFSEFAQSNDLHPVRPGTKEATYSELIELNLFKNEQEKKLFDKSAWVVLGASTALRIVFYDFLVEICFPIFNPFRMENDALRSFLNNSEGVGLEARWAVQLMSSFCKSKSQHLDYVLGFRAILKRQAMFWFELDRKLKKLDEM